MIPEDASLKQAFGPFQRGHEPALVQPFRVAAILAVVYIVLCGTYISVSSRIAARTSGSLQDLEQLEVLKGTLFVVVTGVGLFFLAWTLLRRIARQEMRLARQRAQLVAWERRAAAATFAASAAHDINNVLTVAGGHVHRIAGAQALGPREKESTKRLESAILEISKLADDLLRLGRLGAGGHVESVDLRHVVEQSVEFARTHRRVRHCELVLDATTSPRVHVDASAVVQCVLNLIINAADAAGAGGHIAVRVSQRGDEAFVEVHDDGPGVPEAQREKIFEPFHTTKEAGSGLGLVSVKVCAEQHGGRVEVGTSDLGGACFRVVLPVEKPASPPGDRPAPEAAASV
ncbi:MAG: HAMP domain-containing sensor histidine kinase [bacterium]